MLMGRGMDVDLDMWIEAGEALGFLVEVRGRWQNEDCKLR